MGVTAVASTRGVAFGGSRVTVTATGARARAVVDFVFPSACPDAPGLDSRAAFVVETDAPAGLLTARRDATTLYVGDEPADAARALMECATEVIAEDATGGLLLHAAAVRGPFGTLLLPGATGAGKTTLTAYLVDRYGLRYLTDELTFLPADGAAVKGLRRPLNVKASGRALVEGLARRGWTSLSSPVVALVRPPESATDDDGDGTARVIVFPRYRANADVNLQPLSAADCALRLPGALVNARNLSDRGIGGVIALARQASAFTLEYGEAGAAAECLIRLCQPSGG